MSNQGPLTLKGLREIAEGAMVGIDDGPRLDSFAIALIRVGVAVSVTTLDRSATDRAVTEAFREGATAQQVQEIVSLISGLGVHSLMISATSILAAANAAGESLAAPLTEEQRNLWDKRVGDDPFWSGFEREMPGFLDAMLRLSPAQFEAFFDYCAVPWKSGSVRARVKELVALASDATPTHRFLPGFRVHLANAISLGVGRVAIREALDIAAAAPLHTGTH